MTQNPIVKAIVLSNISVDNLTFFSTYIVTKLRSRIDALMENQHAELTKNYKLYFVQDNSWGMGKKIFVFRQDYNDDFDD